MYAVFSKLANTAPPRPRHPRALNLGHLASPNWLWCIQAITQNQARSPSMEPCTRTYRGVLVEFSSSESSPESESEAKHVVGES